MTRIFDMNSPDDRARGLGAAAAALGEDRLVAVPTETVYGLAADAFSPTAVAAVFAAKGRPNFNPLIVHCPSVAAVGDVAVMGETAERLAEAFWPGPLTLVLERAPVSRIAPAATAGLATVAVRVPAEPVCRDLLGLYGKPLVAPSANVSGHVSATTAAHVVADLGDAVAVVLDAGPSALGIESTIVEVSDDAARILRHGALTRAAIEDALGRPLQAAPDKDTAIVAPGMTASHYAPRAALRLDATSVEDGEALLQFGGQAVANADGAVAVIDLSPSGDLDEAATRLFAALRDLDAVADRIAVVPIPATGAGEAINDRLRRAAAPRY